MTQSIIIEKFIKYLNYYREDQLRELDERIKFFPNKSEQINHEKKELIEKIDTLTSTAPTGLCFGFSLVHAAKNEKLEEWENTLVLLANWDAQHSSLAKEINLTKSINDSIVQYDSKSLKSIFDEAVQDIFVAQVGKHDYFPDMDQHNILQTDGYISIIPASKTDPTLIETEIQRSYFEVLIYDEKKSRSVIKTIEKREIMAGHLTKDQLMNDLDENIPENTIILAHARNHCIRVTRKGKEWLVYDPNYDHTRLKTIHKIGSKSDIIDEIFIILGASLAIEVACYDKQTIINFSEYQKLLNARSIQLLEKGGLAAMAEYMPEKLLYFFKNSCTTEEKTFHKVILRELTQKPSHDSYWTILQTIARYAPSTLLEIFNRINTSPEGSELLDIIINELSKTTQNGWTTLFMIVRYSPDALSLLLRQIDYSPHGKANFNTIITALLKKTPFGWTPLDHIARYHPAVLLAFFKRIDESSEKDNHINTIIKSLTLETSTGWTTLDIIARNSKAALLVLIKSIKYLTDKATLSIIIEGLAHKTPEGVSTLYLMIDNSPNVLNKLLKITDNLPERKKLFTKIINELAQEPKEDLTTLENIALCSPNTLLELFKQIDGTTEGKTLFNVVIKNLLYRTMGNITTLYKIVRFAPDALFELFKHIDTSSEGAQFKELIRNNLLDLSSNDLSHLDSIKNQRLRVACVNIIFDEIKKDVSLSYTVQLIECLLDKLKGLDERIR